MHSPIAGFSIGPIFLSFYGMLIASGLGLGFWLAKRRAHLYGISPRFLDDILLPVVACAIVGARLYHVIDIWTYYSSHLIEIIQLWHGGIGIFGALTGGLIPLIYFAKRSRISLLALLDLLAPSVLLGQAIGRWGNFFNQEAFGPPTNLPWKIFIDPAHRPIQWLGDSFFHPLFLYESLWDLAGFLVLIAVSQRRRSKPGFLVALYLIIFGTGRLLVEYGRFDTAMVGSVKVAILVCIGLIIGGLGLFILSLKARSSQSRP